MKAYGGPKLKGISRRRKSKDSPHRRRCLRVDKKRERRSRRISRESVEA